MTDETRDKLRELLGSASIAALSPIEQRLLVISNQYLPQMILAVRFQPSDSGGTVLPLSPELVCAAVKMSLAAAVEVDETLRGLRTELRKRVEP